MKKIFILLTNIVLGAALVMGTSSCSEDFINETKRDAMSSDWLNEPEGLASMARSLYLNYGYFFSNESSYAYTNYGTDEFMVAGDSSNEMWNTYDARLGSTVTPRVNSNTQDVNTIWNSLYQWIQRANKIIAKADILEGSPLKNETLGIAYFTRGFNYLFLVMQYGDLPLVIDAISTPEREFSRAPRKDVYEQIIKDLEAAYGLLSSNPADATKNIATKYAAAHYLAKAHLWRASEINNDWNASYKDADLQAVIKYADEVIAAHPIVNEYNDLFNNFVNYDTSITETNTEIVFSSGSSNADINYRKSHWGLALFTAWYQGFPMLERDVAGAREYQRMKTTPSYAYYLYDLENDSRFWKSFKTTYAINAAGKVKEVEIDGTKIAVNDYYTGDDRNFSKYMGAMYIINREDYGQKYYSDEVNVDKAPTTISLTRTDYRTGKKIPTIMALNIYDKSGNIVGTSMTPDYNTPHAPLCKYLDGAVDKNNRGDGFRDGLLARSSEDYFFKAEALIRQGKINEGLAVLKPLRDRAQFKAGEARDAYVDGGAALASNNMITGKYRNISAFYPMNSYYYSLGGWDDENYRAAKNATASVLPAVTSSNYPAEDMRIIKKLGYTSDYDKAMCYLLNEKSREMYGEYLRWMDLARTKTLEKRLVFNDQAYSTTLVDITGSTTDMSGTTYKCTYGGDFDPSKHYFRPIPQTHLDNITKDGKPLTADEKAAMQNPGY